MKKIFLILMVCLYSCSFIKDKEKNNFESSKIKKEENATVKNHKIENSKFLFSQIYFHCYGNLRYFEVFESYIISLEKESNYLKYTKDIKKFTWNKHFKDSILLNSKQTKLKKYLFSIDLNTVDSLYFDNDNDGNRVRNLYFINNIDKTGRRLRIIGNPKNAPDSLLLASDSLINVVLIIEKE